MGKPTGFLEISRRHQQYAKIAERIQHFNEFVIFPSIEESSEQGARCMDCGTPYCHNGCPLNNMIPDWNDFVYQGEWQQALIALHSTNNFPEFTGRVCPAPCESACTLNLMEQPVTIKSIECSIVDEGWKKGLIRPHIPSHRTGKKVAVVGSGPSGLACAQQLARAGHSVVVFEKQDRIGGLLRYGIPDFKLSKQLIDRRMGQMQAEGVTFRPNVHVGIDMPVERLIEKYDAIILTGGAEKSRDLEIPGRELNGIYFAMQFLQQQNKRVAGDNLEESQSITAKGKNVIVIGGGDTGSDCIGTSIRQGALSVTQLEILPRPPEKERKELTWPHWPNKFRTSSSQEEGCQRHWSVATQSFEGKNGNVQKLYAINVNWTKDEHGRWQMSEIAGSEFVLDADLVLLAMGFAHPIHEGMLKEFGVKLDSRGNVQADAENYKTSVDKVFVAGDMRRGQSLIVWAIREGRQAARAVDTYLMGSSKLPR
jgi:glutamate synthase (NADPH/NADH) small chain